MTEEIKEKAIFYFQDRLSKFCPADKNRPNEYEINMFIAGYQVAMDEANERIKKLREALEFYANDTSWNSQGHFHNSRIDSTDMSKVELFPIDYEFGGKRARAALKADEEIKE